MLSTWNLRILRKLFRRSESPMNVLWPNKWYRSSTAAMSKRLRQAGRSPKDTQARPEGTPSAVLWSASGCTDVNSGPHVREVTSETVTPDAIAARCADGDGLSWMLRWSHSRSHCGRSLGTKPMGGSCTTTIFRVGEHGPA